MKKPRLFTEREKEIMAAAMLRQFIKTHNAMDTMDMLHVYRMTRGKWWSRLMRWSNDILMALWPLWFAIQAALAASMLYLSGLPR